MEKTVVAAESHVNGRSVELKVCLYTRVLHDPLVEWRSLKVCQSYRLTDSSY